MKCPLLRPLLLLTGFYLAGLGLSPLASRSITLPLPSSDWSEEFVKAKLTTSSSPAATTDSADVLLAEGTRITLYLYEDVASDTHVIGQVVQWAVKNNVLAPKSPIILVKEGAYAAGRVTAVRRAGVFGRPGRIAVNVSTVQTVDGQTIPVYCKPFEMPGKDRRALAWCLGIGLSIIGVALLSMTDLLLLGILPIFLGAFIVGTNASVPSKFTLIEVTVQRDTMIRA